jgi:protein disulfide-isomerase
MVSKWVLTIIAVIGLAFAAVAEEEVHWETDYDVALAKAEATGRFVFMNFTGSDWCIYCMLINKKFFKHEAFIKLAADHFVCLIVDFPRFKEQDEKLKKFNQELAQKHLVRGFPAIIITDRRGKAVGRSGYKRGMDGAQYVEHLSELLGHANLTKSKAQLPENIDDDD